MFPLVQFMAKFVLAPVVTTVVSALVADTLLRNKRVKELAQLECLLEESKKNGLVESNRGYELKIAMLKAQLGLV